MFWKYVQFYFGKAKTFWTELFTTEFHLLNHFKHFVIPEMKLDFQKTIGNSEVLDIRRAKEGYYAL